MTASTIGILGGGQLAAMLTDAAHRLDLDVHVFRESAASGRCPADRITTAPLDDADALRAFAASVEVITIETENIPLEALHTVEEVTPVRPGPAVVAVSQDRLLEKEFLAEHGIATAPWQPAGSEDELRAALERLDRPGIVKTRRLGYDGKGQTPVSPGDDPAAVWRAHGRSPSIVEEVVTFDRELSVVAARTTAGAVAAFDPGANEHRGGILRHTVVPAPLGPGVARRAHEIAVRLLEAHGYVGVLAVEFFQVGEEVLVNETAPRVHNSGHWTQDGCAIDQFEQHVRAITGRPLGATTRHADVVMTNLIGADVDGVDELLITDGVRVHLYGKPETRAGRKMGHVNRMAPLTGEASA